MKKLKKNIREFVYQKYYYRTNNLIQDRYIPFKLQIPFKTAVQTEQSI